MNLEIIFSENIFELSLNVINCSLAKRKVSLKYRLRN